VTFATIARLAGRLAAETFGSVVTATSPRFYYRCAGEPDLEAADEMADLGNGTYMGGKCQQASITPSESGAKSFEVDSTRSKFLSAAFPSSTAFSVMFSYAGTGAGSGARVPLRDSNSQFYFRIDTTNVEVVIRGTTSSSSYASSNIKDGDPHQIVMTWASGGGMKVYVDGTLVHTTGTSTGTASGGTAYLGSNGTFNEYTYGKYADFAWWGSELSSTDVGNLHTAWSTGGDLEAVTEGLSPRFYYRLDDGNTYAADEMADLGDGRYYGEIDGGQSSLVPSDTGAQSFLTDTSGANGEELLSPTCPSSSAFSLMFCYSGTGAGNGGARVLTRDSASNMYLRVDGTNVGLYFNGSENNTGWASSNLKDGNPHLIILAWASGGGLKMYVDGTLRYTTGTRTGTVASAYQVVGRNGTFSEYTYGKYAEVAWWGTELTSTNISDISTAWAA
jgi:hypothetical protein